MLPLRGRCRAEEPVLNPELAFPLNQRGRLRTPVTTTRTERSTTTLGGNYMKHETEIGVLGAWGGNMMPY